MQILHGLSIFLTAALLVRLWLEGLWTRYPAFTAAIGFELLTTGALYLTPPRSNLYAQLFFANAALELGLHYWVLRELCMLVFEDHPGIEAAVRIGVKGSLGLAAAIPLVILAAATLQPNAPFPRLERYFLFYQSGSFFLTILFAGTVLFVAWFPVALRRNIVLYCVGFSLKLVGVSASLLLRNSAFSDSWKQLSNTAFMWTGLFTLVFWLIWINRAGEESRVSLSRGFRASNAEKAVRQLEGLNRTLSEVLRKKPDSRDN
jgi:hypothetical protein